MNYCTLHTIFKISLHHLSIFVVRVTFSVCPLQYAKTFSSNVRITTPGFLESLVSRSAEALMFFPCVQPQVRLLQVDMGFPYLSHGCAELSPRAQRVGCPV